MSWEEPYAEKIDAIRRREIAFFRKTAFINCSNFTIAMMTPVIRTPAPSLRDLLAALAALRR